MLQDVLAEHITARDAAVLQYLEDVRFRQGKSTGKGAAVELVFRPNPCMTDRIVSHSVRLEGGAHSKVDFGVEGRFLPFGSFCLLAVFWR